MAVYKGKPEKAQRTVRTMMGDLVPVLVLTAGQAMAQLTSEGNQLWSEDSDGIPGQAETIDEFGWALATGDFNNDGFADLAIGVQRENVGGEEDAGAVNVIYGGLAGLEAAGNQIWHQDSDGIAGGAEDSDLFGDALAAGDFNNDGVEDLAIGVPLEVIGGNRGAGAVNVIYGGPAGLAATGNQIWHQDSEGIFEIGEMDDNFGRALAAGDFNNDGYEDLAVGVPLDDLEGNQDVGAVNVIYGGPGGLRRPGLGPRQRGHSRGGRSRRQLWSSAGRR